MNKDEILNKYSKPEDKLLISKVFDKIEACKKKNLITNTDFLDLYQKAIVEKILNLVKCNYYIYGGYEDADRVMLVIYPEKITEDIAKMHYKNLVEIIRIKLPKSLNGEYQHKDYLSGIMKLGIRREKFGDILVSENGADIITSKEISKYLRENLVQLTRFNKAEIETNDISDINYTQTKKEELKIIIQSLRLDSIVAQLANTSRTKANEIITEGRVFINYENEKRIDKQVKENDIIVIRGKGKYEISKLEGNTRKNKQILTIKKYK